MVKLLLEQMVVLAAAKSNVATGYLGIVNGIYLFSLIARNNYYEEPSL
jgi:hypothetical protein